MIRLFLGRLDERIREKRRWNCVYNYVLIVIRICSHGGHDRLCIYIERNPFYKELVSAFWVEQMRGARLIPVLSGFLWI